MIDYSVWPSSLFESVNTREELGETCIEIEIEIDTNCILKDKDVCCEK